jgi:nicotinate-nucleotide adenylyltransferase
MRLLLSEEAAAQLNLWKEVGELLRIAPPLIGTRHGAAPPTQEILKQGYIPTRTMEISSTNIRQRLKEKRYCGHLVPAKVLDYIRLHHLYSGS